MTRNMLRSAEKSYNISSLYFTLASWFIGNCPMRLLALNELNMPSKNITLVG